MTIPRISTLSLLPLHIQAALYYGDERGAPLSVTVTIIDTQLRPYLAQPATFCYLYTKGLALASKPLSFAAVDLMLCRPEHRPLVERYWKFIAVRGYALHKKFSFDLVALFRELTHEQLASDGEHLEIDLVSLSRFANKVLKKIESFKTGLAERFRLESVKQRRHLESIAAPADHLLREYWHLQFESRAPTYWRRGCWRQATALLRLIQENEELMGPRTRIPELILKNRIGPISGDKLIHEDLVRM